MASAKHGPSGGASAEPDAVILITIVAVYLISYEHVGAKWHVCESRSSGL